MQHPLKITTLNTLCVLGLIFSQQATAADPISIATEIPYSDSSVGNAAVREECNWTKTFSDLLVKISRGRVVATDQDLNTVQGRVLDIRVTSVHAIGGGAYTGPKWGTIHGDLKESGKTIASFGFTRKTFFSLRMTACGSLNSIASALAKDVNKWTLDPTYRTAIQPPVEGETEASATEQESM